MSGKAAMTLLKGGNRDIASPSRSSATRNRITLQRAAIAPTVEPGAESKVRDTLRSSGQPLDAKTRSIMEPRFGFDFSDVRVHADTQAAESARAVGAHAYAAGSDMVFGDGKYAPSTPAGQQTLSHELTHVVQQASGPVQGTPVSAGMSVSHPTDSFERAATEGASHPHASGLTSAAEAPHEPGPPLQHAGGAKSGSQLQVQRDAAQQSADAATSSATSGAVSAGGSVASGLGGLASGLGALLALGPAGRAADAAERSANEAHQANTIGARSADAAERSATAAEDPPVAAPATGGFTVAHAKAEQPKVKGDPVDKPPVSIFKVATSGGDLATLDVAVSSTKDGKIAQANTQNGDDFSGYLGGSTGSNATVNLTAGIVPKDKQPDVLQVKFDGTNVGPHLTKSIQRFRGTAKVTAEGTLAEAPKMSGKGVVNDPKGAIPVAMLNIDVLPPKQKPPIPIPKPTPQPPPK